MKEERLKILEMLQEGKITADEAAKLLEHLPSQQENKQNQQRPDVYVYDTDNENGNFDNYSYTPRGGGILDTIVDAISNINPHTPALYRDFEISGIQAINLLDLTGKNSSVSVEKNFDNSIKIHCKYSPKRGYDDIDIHFAEENGEYRLQYNQNAVRFMKVNCELPAVLVEKLRLQTSNSSINVEEVTCTTLDAYTSNASINLEELTAKNIVAETSNSSINLEEVTAETAKISTSNAKINVEEVDIPKLSLSTSNASISVEGLLNTQNTQNAENPTLKASTSNGGISVTLPAGIGVKLSADTSHGSVKCDLADNPLLGKHQSGGGNLKTSGENNLYKETGRGLEVKLSTSNGGIKISEE
ncbi:MAG: DUF4097 family beta strand repeat-containing protein [Defluviitaleaceae bacterium]|nr:DUF4097 family beta strand repeat-containing protein [Defluviitaleaceae bacterium]